MMPYPHLWVGGFHSTICSKSADGDLRYLVVAIYLMTKLFKSLNNHVEGSLYGRVRCDSPIMLTDAKCQPRRVNEVRDFIFVILPPRNLVAQGIVQPRLLGQQRFNQQSQGCH